MRNMFWVTIYHKYHGFTSSPTADAVLAVTPEQFRRVNGYSNLYLGPDRHQQATLNTMDLVQTLSIDGTAHHFESDRCKYVIHNTLAYLDQYTIINVK